MVLTSVNLIQIFACGTHINYVITLLVYIPHWGVRTQPGVVVGKKTPLIRLHSPPCPHATLVHGTEFIFDGVPGRLTTQTLHGLGAPLAIDSNQCGPCVRRRSHQGEPLVYWGF